MLKYKIPQIVTLTHNHPHPHKTKEERLSKQITVPLL